MPTATKTPAAIRRELPQLTGRKLPAEVANAPAAIAKPASEYEGAASASCGCRRARRRLGGPAARGRIGRP